MNKNTDVNYSHLGLIDYQQAWDIQKSYFSKIVDVKLVNRKQDKQLLTPNYLLFCEHTPVFTIGKTGSENHLLVNQAVLKEKGISFYHIDRGGDITYHGPGQLVGYPILDLDNFFTDIHRYLRCLEEAVILMLSDYGIQAGRVDGMTGVWIGQGREARKICAMGVRTSRWVTMHGFALNVNTELDYFNYIIPCGIQDKAVTSMKKELGKDITMSDVEQKLLSKLAAVFEMKIINDKR